MSEQSDPPDYPGMTRRGSRYEVRVSIDPQEAAALVGAARLADSSPSIVLRGVIRAWRIQRIGGPT